MWPFLCSASPPSLISTLTSPLHFCHSLLDKRRTLEELLKRPPFSPGKYSAVDSSLRLKLASVDSCYNFSPRSTTPIFQNDDAFFSPNRPLSPQTDGSSPRSSSSHQNTLAEPDSLSSSPRQFNDSVSEPGNDKSSLSPPESRRTLLRSTNSARPHINLSGNTGPLKASTGSSPFRDASCNSKRFTRTRSNPDNGLSSDAGDVCQKLAF
jgi:hypothetical protein